MADTTFRPKKEVADKPVEFNEPKDKKTVEAINNIPVPHSDYQKQNQRPFTADYYGLGELWQPHHKEIGLIEGYFNGKIESGELPNDTSSIKAEMKRLERFLNLKDETRPVVKIGVLSAHIKFLLETDIIKQNTIKYGNYK